eukprot:TRINITY_DN20065_c0_g1_i4.p1 TRINITY_DN20065_c0_g1~~TRINITY_DN20065_c0_g1_i4.p1  ORF type:complete len:348 (-),score=90.29 TRINITY_DN20065_c0_g1_i4:70-1113(-)
MTACVTTAPVATRMHGSGGGYGATDALQRASRDSVASAGCSEVSPELQKKALEKEEIVRRIIQNIERALKNNRDQDRQWLQAVCDPSDACFRTLVQLAVEPKYEVFVRLRCCALRAVQMLLRVAVTMVQEGRAEFASDASIGLRLFKEMAGDKLALQAFPIILDAARKHETPLLACDCLFVLAELGPEALALRCQVACRIHAWGGELRSQLLQAAAAHRGGKLMCEVLIQMINRADTMRKLRATKVLTGCLSMPSGETLLYTNDARVLVEILLRDLQNTADDVVSFTLFSDCLKAVISASDALRQEDKRQEFIKVLTMLQEDETVPPDVRQVAANVLAVGMAKVNAT